MKTNLKQNIGRRIEHYDGKDELEDPIMKSEFEIAGKDMKKIKHPE